MRTCSFAKKQRAGAVLLSEASIASNDGRALRRNPLALDLLLGNLLLRGAVHEKMAIINASLDHLVIFDDLLVHVSQEVLLLFEESFERGGVELLPGEHGFPHFLQLKANAFLEHLKSIFAELEIELRKI